MFGGKLSYVQIRNLNFEGNDGYDEKGKEKTGEGGVESGCSTPIRASEEGIKHHPDFLCAWIRQLGCVGCIEGGG